MTVSQFTDFFQQLLICKTPEKKQADTSHAVSPLNISRFFFIPSFLSILFFYLKYSFIRNILLSGGLYILPYLHLQAMPDTTVPYIVRHLLHASVVSSQKYCGFWSSPA